jgi:ABC-type glycerol-3-phosphate transport system substrate-binding protein
MQYRKDLAEDAGYDPEGENWATEPMSWQEWSNVTADILEQSSGVDHGFTTQWDIYEGTSCCTFLEVMSSWGGAYFGDPSQYQFGPVGDRPITVDEQQVVDSLNMMRKFVHGEDFDKFSDYAGNIAPTAITSWTEEDARAPFAQGNAIMHRNWPYSIALTGRSEEDVEEGTPVLGTDRMGVMPIPYGVTEDEASYPQTGGTVSALGGWHATVNPNSEKHDAVAQVIEAMQADDFQLTLLSAQGWLPPKPALFESSEAQNVDIVGNYMDTLRVAGENALARPVTTVWTQESSAIAQRANDAVAQASTSRSAMDQLADQLAEIEG